MGTQSKSRWLERASIITALGVFFAMASPAYADVYLHPGKLAGPTGLSGWRFTASDLILAGNANNFRASTSWSSGEFFELTTEGGETYKYLHLRRYFTGGYFYQTSTADFHVPINDTLNV